MRITAGKDKYESLQEEEEACLSVSNSLKATMTILLPAVLSCNRNTGAPGAVQGKTASLVPTLFCNKIVDISCSYSFSAVQSR